LIHREKLIPTLQSLISLSHRTALGIATGRPRDQALFALQTMGIADLFRAVVALEDVMAAEEKQFADHGSRMNLSKPHPFMLLECARKIGGTRLAYVGDTLDDIRAANAAKRERNFLSIGCLAATEDKAHLRREFERVGADIVIEHPDELVGLIETRPGRF
jgi:HAD superfamily hydrolase (TIGR01549 family)